MSGFRHRAYYGMSGQGKSTLVKHLCRGLAAKKQLIIVYNPMGDDDWPPSAVMTYNADQLEKALADPKNHGAHVVIDEAQVLRIQYKQNLHPFIATLGNVGRHYGYTMHLIGQYPTAVPPHMRWNCSECFCFALAKADHAKEVFEDYGAQNIEGLPVWSQILKLPHYTCVHLTRFTAEVLAVPAPRR